MLTTIIAVVSDVAPRVEVFLLPTPPFSEIRQKKTHNFNQSAFVCLLFLTFLSTRSSGINDV
jgi:hypothetical protein